MPNLNIPIKDSLLREVNKRVIDSGMSQKEWVIRLLAETVGWVDGPESESRDGNGVVPEAPERIDLPALAGGESGSEGGTAGSDQPEYGPGLQAVVEENLVVAAPKCPICDRPLTSDNDQWVCQECDKSWTAERLKRLGR